MKTLIELYDERPLDNVLATEMFRPEETVFICPHEVAADSVLKSALNRYFRLRGCPTRLTFVPVSMTDAGSIAATLDRVLKDRQDCAIDISGGTDASLFAAGQVSGDTPVFTYSRGKNSFFDIRNAPFARNTACTVHLDARACFLMAGGELLPGREDNRLLRGRLQDIDRLFDVYTRFRKVWNSQLSYIQKLQPLRDEPLSADGPTALKADNRHVKADERLFRALQDAGLIRDLQLSDERIRFFFPDETVRFWLRDMGSVLELQVYRACLKTERYDDVVLSAVVNWQSADRRSVAVTNEIDVMAVRGVTPTFISCKTSEIRTEALNELAILRDRFGGKGSRAVIVTSSPASRSRAVTRRRASELKIDVIEWEDVALDRLVKRLSPDVP